MNVLWIRRGLDPRQGFQLSKVSSSKEVRASFETGLLQNPKQNLYVDCDLDAYLTVDPQFHSPDARFSGSLELTSLDFLSDLLPKNQALFPMVALDPNDRELMVAWGNEESLRIALKKGLGTYYSRSRKEQWTKGETSGHTQKILYWEYVKDPFYIVYHVEQTGAACHTGYYTCFYREELLNGEQKVILPGKVE